MELPYDVWGEIKEFVLIPKKTNTPHPNAYIMKKEIEELDYCPCYSRFNLFTHLNYYATFPLTNFGTNGRNIHNDYDIIWRPFNDFNEDNDYDIIWGQFNEDIDDDEVFKLS